LNQDGQVNVLDLNFALQAAVGRVPLDDCVLQAGDMNGDGELDSADIVMLSRYIIGLALNPPQAGSRLAQRFAKGAPALAPAISLAHVEAAPGGGVVAVPMRIADGEGATGFDLVIGYPGAPGQLEFERLELGNITSDFTPVANSETPGLLRVALSRETELREENGAGVVITLFFNVPMGLAHGTTLPITLNGVKLKGQFGGSFDWYSVINLENGAVSVSTLDCTVGPVHTADQDSSSTIGLNELLRLIQFFNSGRFGCQAGSEDGFAPGVLDQGCCPHDSDYEGGPSWSITLGELLRLIQFFNSGGYRHCPANGTEDGYCPGL
jgi:hypothetical protein